MDNGDNKADKIDEQAQREIAERALWIQRNVLLKRLENDHVFHPVKEGQAERYGQIRAAALEFARTCVNLGVPSRELSTALTHIDSAVFFTNASIARNE